MIRHLLLLTTLAGALPGAVIYSNATNDALSTVLFSAAPYSEIGDRIQAGGTARLAETAEVEFYNAGSDGVFDAVLRLFQPGAPVGGLLSQYSLTGLTATSLASTRVLFPLGGEVLPDELIFTIEIQNATAGVDLGLNLYDPPGAAGSSSTQFLIVRNASYAEIAAGRSSNLYFVLTADGASSAVPEPATLLPAAAGLALLNLARRRWRAPRDGAR